MIEPKIGSLYTREEISSKINQFGSYIQSNKNSCEELNNENINNKDSAKKNESKLSSLLSDVSLNGKSSNKRTINEFKNSIPLDYNPAQEKNKKDSNNLFHIDLKNVIPIKEVSTDEDFESTSNAHLCSNTKLVKLKVNENIANTESLEIDVHSNEREKKESSFTPILKGVTISAITSLAAISTYDHFNNNQIYYFSEKIITNGLQSLKNFIHLLIESLNGKSINFKKYPIKFLEFMKDKISSIAEIIIKEDLFDYIFYIAFIIMLVVLFKCFIKKFKKRKDNE